MIADFVADSISITTIKVSNEVYQYNSEPELCYLALGYQKRVSVKDEGGEGDLAEPPYY